MSVESLIQSGPTEKLSDVKPQPPATVPDITQLSTDKEDTIDIPAGTEDKPFDPKLFGQEPDEQHEKKLKEEEQKAAEREAALKKQEAEKKSDVKTEDKDDKTKSADKSADTKVEEGKKEDTGEFKPAPITSVKKGERDYTGLDESEKTILNKASHETFEFAKARIVELKETKAKVKELEEKLTKSTREDLPDHYYEHPKSYLLDDRYHKSVETANNVMQEVSHWEQQVVRIEKGEKWVDIQKDEKTGQYRQFIHEPSAEARNYVNRKIMNGDAIVREHAAFAQQLEQESAQRGEALRKGIIERENYLFPDLKDPKVFESNKYIKGMYNYLKEGGLEHDLLARGFCKMYAKLIETQNENDELRKGEKVTKIEEKVKESSGPSSSEINKGASEKSKDVPKTKDEVPFDPKAFSKLHDDEEAA